MANSCYSYLISFLGTIIESSIKKFVNIEYKINVTTIVFYFMFLLLLMLLSLRPLLLCLFVVVVVVLNVTEVNVMVLPSFLSVCLFVLLLPLRLSCVTDGFVAIVALVYCRLPFIPYL